MIIDHASYYKFCLNQWPVLTKEPLTPNETKVYNMTGAGFPRESIMTRLSISESRVRGIVRQLEAKGWL